MENEVDGEDEEYNVEYVEVHTDYTSPAISSTQTHHLHTQSNADIRDFILDQNFDESDDEEDEIEEAAEKIYEQIQGQSL